jgi:hypothetical protein
LNISLGVFVHHSSHETFIVNLIPYALNRVLGWDSKKRGWKAEIISFLESLVFGCADLQFLHEFKERDSEVFMEIKVIVIHVLRDNDLRDVLYL